MSEVIIYGGGLAGCEAALTLAELGVEVDLIEEKFTSPKVVYTSKYLAELVCSNSLKAKRPYVASGMLKAEAAALGSRLLEIAQNCQVEAGGALAVDRTAFSAAVTEAIKQEKLINLRPEKATELTERDYQIVATGPLSDGKFLDNLQLSLKKAGNDTAQAYFFDAQAPLVEKDSLDMERAFYMSRYERGEAAYLNCPMTKEEYDIFYDALVNAERAEVHDFEKKLLFQGCMPVEQIALTGYKSLLFGPLKPVGLIDPHTGKRPYACVQLRQDNSARTLYNMVGFQTQLKWSEQKRVFSLIPALKQAEFSRYGVMHRNTYLHSPAFLQPDLSTKNLPYLFFAGQITGMEGYVPAISSGIWAAISVYMRLKGKKNPPLPPVTMLGSLISYVTHEQKDFQPMTANMGILPALAQTYRDKKLKGIAYSALSLEHLSKYLQEEIQPYFPANSSMAKRQNCALATWREALAAEREAGITE